VVGRKHFSSERAVLQWQSCPGRRGGSPSLEVFENCGDVDVVLGTVGWGGVGLGVFKKKKRKERKGG